MNAVKFETNSIEVTSIKNNIQLGHIILKGDGVYAFEASSDYNLFFDATELIDIATKLNELNEDH